MKLSLRGEYALRSLVVLGLIPQDEVIHIHRISERQNIPRKFLEQILHEMKNAGLLESRRGRAGGYRLKSKPEEISLAMVIRLIEGPLAPVSCVSEKFYDKCTCPDEQKCAIRSIMKEVRDAIVRQLEKVTVADLCVRAIALGNQKTNSLEYII